MNWTRLAIVAVLAVSTVVLSSEAIKTPDLNDNVLHLTIINGMVNAVEHGQNPFTFWSPEISLGQPIASMYQIGAHAIVALLYFLLFKSISITTIFVWFKFLALVLIPLSFFWVVQLLGFSSATQIASAVLSLLVSGDSFGIDLGSYVWAGHGLFPQLIATHFLLLTIGFGWCAIRHGSNWWIPGLLLGMTGWCNLLYGYVGSVTLCIAVFISSSGMRHRVWQYIKIICLAAMMAIPKLLVWATVTRVSSKELGARSFMSDSFGATKVLHDLVTGMLFDQGRLPILTILVALGIVVALRYGRHETTFVLCAEIMWLLLYFGRPFWGSSLWLLGILPAMQLHRFIGPVQIFAVMLAAIGLGCIWDTITHRGYMVIAVFLLLSPVIQERLIYASSNAQWSAETRVAFAFDGPAIEQAMRCA